MRVVVIGAIAAALYTGAFASPALAQTGAVATKEYDSGAVYVGEFRDGKQHGQGTYTAPDGYEYTGTWVNGVIDGQGKARFPNGSVYEGQFAEGVPSGKG